MTSNEHGAIKQNVEYHETNNLTYYTSESELHARSYALSNMSICYRMQRNLDKNRARESIPGVSRFRTDEPEGESYVFAMLGMCGG